MKERRLRIGYLWQYESTKLPRFAATDLHIRAVVDGFRRRGHEVRIVSYRKGKPHWSEDFESWNPIDVRAGESKIFRLFESTIRGTQSRLRLPYIRFFESYRFAAGVHEALKGYDVLYERFWLNGYGGLLGASRLQVPIVYEMNGDLVEEYDHLGIELSRAQWATIHFITRQMFRRAARVATVSESLRRITIERWEIEDDKVTTVPNGAHVSMFVDATTSDKMLNRYGLDSAPAVIFVGSFKPWHGVELLVDAFSRVAQHQLGARLILVGDGATRPQMEKKVRELNLEESIIFTGKVSHEKVSDLLNAAQIAVLNPRVSPSARAGSPLKMFEYLAAGKAIVAPRLENYQEVLIDGENALLVPPDDAQALSDALLRLLSDEALRTRLGEIAQKHAVECYSWDNTVAKLEKIFYEELHK